ncbi:TPA: hypothetical protein OOF39_000411 [Kluyvera ascorbata]|nr:hypothetical protein [Kluyvera ascorbata]
MTTPDSKANENHSDEVTGMTTPPSRIRRIRNELSDVLNDTGVRKILMKTLKSGIRQTPGLGTALTLLEEGYQEVIALETKQRRARIEQFVTGLSLSLPGQADISEADFLAVLHKVLQDDEEEKIWLYVRLLIKLGNGTFDKDTRFHFINMTYSLTFKQIKFSRELYLRKTLELKGYDTKEEAELALTDNPEGMTQRALSVLTSWGLIREDRTGPIRAVPRYLLNDDMHTLIDLLYDKRDLTPEEIGRELKDRPDVIILTSMRSDKELFVTELPQSLERQGLNVDIMSGNSDHQKTKLAPLYVFLRTGEENIHYRRQECTYICVRTTPDTAGDSLVTVRILSSIFNGTDISKTSRDTLRDKLNRVAEGVLRLHKEHVLSSGKE